MMYFRRKTNVLLLDLYANTRFSYLFPIERCVRETLFESGRKITARSGYIAEEGWPLDVEYRITQ